MNYLLKLWCRMFDHKWLLVRDWANSERAAEVFECERCGDEHANIYY